MVVVVVIMTYPGKRSILPKLKFGVLLLMRKKDNLLELELELRYFFKVEEFNRNKEGKRDDNVSEC